MRLRGSNGARVLGAVGLLATLSLAGVQATGNEILERVIAHADAHPEGRAPCAFDRSAYLGETRHLPIGVFDSGIGGLTVLEAILALDAFDNETLSPGPDGRKDFENERFVYFGDQANMPYGNYPARGKEGYLRERILGDAVFLLGTRAWSGDGTWVEIRKPAVKAIVIACNTATAYGLEDVRAAIRAWGVPVPVMGIVEAGARGALEGRRGESDAAIAVLATVGTCDSGAYPKAIGRAFGLAGKTMPPLIQQGSVGLAGAIEGESSFIRAAGRATIYQGPRVGHQKAPLLPDRMAAYGFTPDGVLGDSRDPGAMQLNSVRAYVSYDVATLVENHRTSGVAAPIGTVVLGCTHFPLVQDEIAAAFWRLRDLEISGARPFRSLVAEGIEFLDPAELLAKELFRRLAVARLRLTPAERGAMDRDLFFISVANPSWPCIKLAPDGSLDAEYKYGREDGRLETEDTRAVPMSVDRLAASSTNLIQTHLPSVWKRLARVSDPR